MKRLYIFAMVAAMVARCFGGATVNLTGVPSSAAFNDSVTLTSVAQSDPEMLYGHYIYVWRPSASNSEIIWSTYQDYIHWGSSPRYRSTTATITLNEPGVWKIAANASYFPEPFDNAVTTPIDTGWYYVNVSAPPVPSINSGLELTYAQRQSFSYQITATNSPTSYGATGLPAGLSINTSTGVISGQVVDPGTYSPQITAYGTYGSNTKTLIINISAATFASTAYVSPQVAPVGSTFTLLRSGSTGFTFSHTEGTIWYPTSGGFVLPTLPWGTSDYVPDQGAGSYEWQFRIADIYGNYKDTPIKLYVSQVSPFTLSVSGGPSFNVLTSAASIELGQTVTVSGTLYDPTNQLTNFALKGDQGVAGNLVTYANSAVSFSARSTYAFSVTYQPLQRQSGTYYMAAFGSSYNEWSKGFSLAVNKATPNGSFSSRSFAPNSPGYYSLSSADLNAVFTNPYSASVAAPSNNVTYRIQNGATVSAGSNIPTGSNIIEASFNGDANYNPKTVAATFTVSGPTTPSSFQPTLTGSTLVTLSWQASSSPVGINRYEVLRGGVVIGTTSSTALNYTDTSALPSTSYTYSVRCVDNNGNYSGLATFTVTTARDFVIFSPTP